MKPRSFYDTADQFCQFFGDKPIERVEYVEKVVHGFSAETLKWAEECAKEYEKENGK